VGVSEWLGKRIRKPGEAIIEGAAMQAGDRWPTAAFGVGGKVWGVDVSMWPVHRKYQHLSSIVNLETADPLSVRGAAGFLARTSRAKLRFVDGFLADVDEHVRFMTGEVSVVA
jgi:DNA (cytosine-5)-methyltransferase 1